LLSFALYLNIMDELSFNNGVQAALDSLLNDRLALLAGAGLSMAPPSSLPSAAAIAKSAKDKYDATYGTTRPPLAVAIEDQAQHFFVRGELATVYFRTLIDQHAFAGPPNSGHAAVADLLLVRAIQTAVTTNVDTLIEDAGHLLFGQVEACLDGHAVARLHPDISPLLKIHGCRARDVDNMLWAPGQLSVPPVSERIASSRTCLVTRLLDRDLLIVGYWTDWDYLNSVLENALGSVRPARVIVVDTSDGATFAAKAPALFALGQRALSTFWHVRASGADFLDALRRAFSKIFIRRVLHSGIDAYVAQMGSAPHPAWLEPPDLDAPTLWLVRRDLEGRVPNEPAKDKSPPDEGLVGQTLLQLQAAGAQSDGHFWLLNGRRVRVLRAANRPLHLVEADFAREMAPAVAPDVVIAVGAEAQFLPPNIVRTESSGTIARGSRSLWMSRPDAVRQLGLQ
jgi:hypothetical protein